MGLPLCQISQKCKKSKVNQHNIDEIINPAWKIQEKGKHYYQIRLGEDLLKGYIQNKWNYTVCQFT